MQAVKLLVFTAVYLCMSYGVQAQSLPEGEGKQIVANICNQCHELRFVTDTRRTREQWQYIVTMMISLGAPVPEDKVETVMNYLSKNFGRTGAPNQPGAGE